MKYKVNSLDVCGHNSLECKDYDCNCIVKNDDDIDATQHDNEACSCGYEVNDFFAHGEIDRLTSDEQGLLDALINDGYLVNTLTLKDIKFEDVSESDDASFFVYDKHNMKPIYLLVPQKD